MANIIKGLGPVNQNIYQEVTLSIHPTNWGFARDFRNVLDMDLNIVGNFTGVTIGDLALYERAIKEGKIKKERLREPMSPSEEQWDTVLHEYFHILQYNRPEIEKAFTGWFFRNEDAINKIVLLRKHIDTDYYYGDEPGGYHEIGPILATEQVYNRQAFYQVAFPDLYKIVYNSGYFRPGMLESPGSTKLYQGLTQKKLFELF